MGWPGGETGELAGGIPLLGFQRSANAFRFRVEARPGGGTRGGIRLPLPGRYRRPNHRGSGRFSSWFTWMVTGPPAAQALPFAISPAAGRNDFHGSHAERFSGSWRRAIERTQTVQRGHGVQIRAAAKRPDSVAAGWA